jgi:ribosome-binding protein aMBF1 (putative translation factor)
MDEQEQKMPDLIELKKQLLSNAAVRQQYDLLAGEFALAQELIAARVRAGLSQQELAEKMQTSQSAIVRLESGRSMPSMRTLARYAAATGSKAVVRLEVST